MIKPHLPKETTIKHLRRVALHSAAILFFIDMAHVVIGRFPMCDGLYCSVREPLVTWAALAAVLIVYWDDHERQELHQEINAVERRLDQSSPPSS